MKISNKLLIILNCIVVIIFLFPLQYLNLFNENYSTLSLNTRGYFYLLFIGIIMGLLLGYETYIINNLKYGIIMFIALLIGVIVPHHYPYDLQGNIHLLLAYIGSFISILITYMNIMKYNNRTLQNILIFSIGIVILMYMKYMMFNCIAEVVLMLTVMICNLVIYIKISRT